MKNLIIYLFLLMVSGPGVLAGQSEIIMGIIGNQLVSIHQQTAQITVLAEVNVPANVVTDDLVYSKADNAFYTYINALNYPKLVRIGWDGSYKEIGSLKLKGERLGLCEGLTLRESDGKVFAAGALSSRGGLSNLLLTVNLETAECNLVNQLPISYQYTDMDNIYFWDGDLFFDDNRRNIDLSVFRVDRYSLTSPMQPTRVLRTKYFSATDVAVIGTSVFFVTGDRYLGVYSPESFAPPRLIGPTHDRKEYSGGIFNGITAVPLTIAK
ncbi:hypothetical protein QWY85_18575 [Neolewinella lacunae]|uniref:Uncharacterized protein n=1 Tax=Neolewinella lacunae TaxID=1517758 RepID=A0A923PM20_9BACT|nr:hypothetical protein [Neolewinella lacunae]MBC6994171.1 hypothetical protein [Neolewinella lacunae]MDN3636680.1 hypothetical protein [Neolewinella lacunae]